MKYIKLKILMVLLASAWLMACEDEEAKVTFKGATPPVLTVSATSDQVLQKDKAGYNSLQFDWTNPEYEFSNGSNTQDVTYTLEVDTVGSNFSNPKKVALGFTNSLSKNFKVSELNSSLSGLELKDDLLHNFEFRVKAALVNGNGAVYSNAVAVKVSTYLDVVYPVPAKLFLTGAATPKGWMAGGDVPDGTQELTKINAYTFQIASIHMKASSPYLFVPVYGNWDHKIGFPGEKEKNSPLSDRFSPDGDGRTANDLLSPSDEKDYKITVNFKTGKYTFEAL
jgi:hypothetical protein